MTNMSLDHTWRWFGPEDTLKLSDIRQAGVSGIVSALHHIPAGEVWTLKDLKERKRQVEWDDSHTPAKPTGLVWSVVESIPVHESIKTGSKERDKYIENYKQSISNVAAIGLKTITYNFMPGLDAIRTDWEYELEDGSKALRFDLTAFAAFDLFILKRKETEKSYTKDQIKGATTYYTKMDNGLRKKLMNTVLSVLPGPYYTYSLQEFQAIIDRYRYIDTRKYKENLFYFLKQIIPVAEKTGVKMAIHPDDPPYSLLGLPRIVSSEQDIREILETVNSMHNGFTLCTGSLAPNPDNDLTGIVERLGSKIHFIHLRSIQREENGSFYETGHLQGDVDIYHILVNILKEQKRRRSESRNDDTIPMRADHGLVILDDLKKKKINPGYSAIGLLKGTAELKGMETAIERSGII
jgi:mannonate dehydratase